VKFKPYERPVVDKGWATVGKPTTRKRNFITSLHILPERMEQHNLMLAAKYREVEQAEVRFEEMNTADAEYLFVAYGLCARICHKAMDIAREKGIKVGLLRPITLWPFPEKRLYELAGQVKQMLSVELNTGQMVQDVKLAVNGKVPVHFYGRLGGMVPTPEEIVNHLETLINYHHAN
jgi:2-oxoglutarate ferredoxin oxidoreductase subunit alpha